MLEKLESFIEQNIRKIWKVQKLLKFWRFVEKVLPKIYNFSKSKDFFKGETIEKKLIDIQSCAFQKSITFRKSFYGKSIFARKPESFIKQNFIRN